MDAQGASGSPGANARPQVSRALVVEDDAALCRTLLTALRPWAIETRSAENLAEARRQLSEFRPELLVLDFMLPDGTAADLLADVIATSPLPAIVAMSAFAEPKDSFLLAELGVRAYLQKPIDLRAFDEGVRKALMEPPAIDVSARQAVGRVGLKDAEQALRRVMVKEALDRAGGSRRGAARLLKISREFLQHALRKLRD
jgi:DNA-binding NtrC family response regulator